MNSESTTSEPAPPSKPKEYPCNFRTLLFCFLVGSIFSIPWGVLFRILDFPEPPLWTAPFYWGTVVTSMAVLPFWSGFALRDQPDLRDAGLRLFAVALFLLILGSLFPAL